MDSICSVGLIKIFPVVISVTTSPVFRNHRKVTGDYRVLKSKNKCQYLIANDGSRCRRRSPSFGEKSSEKRNLLVEKE